MGQRREGRRRRWMELGWVVREVVMDVRREEKDEGWRGW